MKWIQISGFTVAARTRCVAIFGLVFLALIPCSLRAETIAGQAQKIAASAKAAELFARLAEEQKAAGDFWLCFRFAAASGAAAEAAARIAGQLIDRIQTLPAAQQSQHESFRVQAGVDSQRARQAADRVQGFVMQGLGLITILLLFFVAVLIWLIRRGAVGPFIKRPEAQG